MKNVKLCFKHPVKGVAMIMQPKKGKIIKSFQIQSNDDFEVNIPLNGIASGNCELIFEWEKNGEFFIIKKNIVVD